MEESTSRGEVWRKVQAEVSVWRKVQAEVRCGGKYKLR